LVDGDGRVVTGNARLTASSLYLSHDILKRAAGGAGADVVSLPAGAVFVGIDPGHTHVAKAVVLVKPTEPLEPASWAPLIEISRASVVNKPNRATGTHHMYKKAQEALGEARLHSPAVGVELGGELESIRKELVYVQQMQRHTSRRQQKRSKDVGRKLTACFDRLANATVAAARKKLNARRDVPVVVLFGDAQWNGARMGASYASKFRLALQRLVHVIVVDVREFNTSSVCMICKDPLCRNLSPVGDKKRTASGRSYFPLVRGLHVCATCHTPMDRDYGGAMGIAIKACSILITGQVPDWGRPMPADEWRSYLLARLEDLALECNVHVSHDDVHAMPTSQLYAFACGLRQSAHHDTPQGRLRYAWYVNQATPGESRYKPNEAIRMAARIAVITPGGGGKGADLGGGAANPAARKSHATRWNALHGAHREWLRKHYPGMRV
jgi:hypothetical protein